MTKPLIMLLAGSHKVFLNRWNCLLNGALLPNIKYRWYKVGSKFNDIHVAVE